MNFFLLLLIYNLEKLIFSSIVVFPFELNEINFKKEKYTSTELINILFEKEFYTPLDLGEKNQQYFGLISFKDHHPILSEDNCKKKEFFKNNKDIIEKGYLLSKSITKKYLGNTIDYLNTIKFVEYYSEQLWYFNETLLEDYKDMKNTEIFLLMDNYTKFISQEKCLSIGLNEPFKVYSDPSPPHFIDDLRSRNKIETQDWTIKFTDENKGQLIIGDLPHVYEKNNTNYLENNYTKCNTECIITFFQPWGLSMKEIYFNNSTNHKIVINSNNNKFVLVHNFGFIVGSNKYKELIYENYFSNLITENICVLEKSDVTKYNRSHYFINTDGDYSMFICQKDKMDIHLKNFPTLYFTHLPYEYIFELDYKDLFKEINNYYYFMIIFPNTKPDDYDEKGQEDWHLGLPFLKKYQFVFNFDYKSIGFYKFKNYGNDDENKEQNIKESKGDYKVWLIIIEVLIVMILIIAAFFIGKYLSKQRKKRANELKDDDYEYIEEKFKENESNLIN